MESDDTVNIEDTVLEGSFLPIAACLSTSHISVLDLD